MSAVTLDLYRPMHSLFRGFAADGGTRQAADAPVSRLFPPVMGPHSVKGDAIPARVRRDRESFNTVLPIATPPADRLRQLRVVRANLSFLKAWIAERLADLANGKTANPEKTFAWYWIKNAGDGENFRHKDVVFECFHNFVAFSQWGNTIYNIMLKLAADTGDPDARASFKKTMEGNFDQAGGPFTALERLVMELFRTITPNGGSISALAEVRTPPYERHGYIVTPHAATSFDPVQWKNPEKFDPDRYNIAPTSHQIDDAKCQQLGFAKCPFEQTTFEVKDGRKATLHNSGFGTVYGIVDGKPLPVCDHAGFAPFGFGYRRCPGEQLTIQVFEDFLRKVWRDKIEFVKLNIANPEPLPIGPTTVIGDNVGFRRTA